MKLYWTPASPFTRKVNAPNSSREANRTPFQNLTVLRNFYDVLIIDGLDLPKR